MQRKPSSSRRLFTTVLVLAVVNATLVGAYPSSQAATTSDPLYGSGTSVSVAISDSTSGSGGYTGSGSDTGTITDPGTGSGSDGTVAVPYDEQAALDQIDIDLDAMIADWIESACFGMPPMDPGDETPPVQPPLGDRPSDQAIRDALTEVDAWAIEAGGATSDDPFGGGMEIFDCASYGVVLANPPNPKRIKEIELAIKALREITEVGKRLAGVLGRLTVAATKWGYGKTFIALGKKLALIADFDARVKLANLVNKLNALAKAKGWSEAKRLAAEHKLVSSFLRNNGRALAKSTLVALVLMGAGWGAKYAWDKVFPPQSLKDAQDATKKANEALDAIKKLQNEAPGKLTKSTQRIQEAIDGLKKYAAALAAAGDDADKKAKIEADFDTFLRQYKSEIEFLAALAQAHKAQTAALQELESFEKALKKLDDVLKNKQDGEELSDAEIDALMKEVIDGLPGDGPTDEEIDAALKKLEIPDGADN